MGTYYSVIQLQPEPYRIERINIGVLLWEETPDELSYVHLSLPEYGFYRGKYAYAWIGTTIFRETCEREIRSFLTHSQPCLRTSIIASEKKAGVYEKIFYRLPIPVAMKPAQEIDEIITDLLTTFIYVPSISPKVVKLI